MQSVTQRRRESGFTLVELLVVIGIIALLVGILIPTIARVRQAAFATDSAATVRALTNAIQTYYDDFQAYPGPLADDQIGIGLGNFSFPAPGDRSANFTFDVDDDGTDDDSLLENIAATNGITGTENLALGLLGGLVLDAGGAILYDPQAVGSGPRLLGGTPGSRPSYVDLERDRLGFTFAADNKETGRFRDNTASANDTIIPEFVDSFPSPMPILYLR
ncbi:MAG: type II secretion system protein, partial [Planctomycetota bacterium]